MKVRELQEQLSKFDPEMHIVCYSEDERLLVDNPLENRGFILFDISGTNVTEAEMLRLDDGTPYLKLERGPKSTKMVTLDITSDF